MKEVTNSIREMRAPSVDGDDDDGVVAREVVYPPQYFLLGFKDRSLEAEYQEYLVGVSKARLILGLVVALLLFLICFFIPNLFLIQGVQNYMVSTHTHTTNTRRLTDSVAFTPLVSLRPCRDLVTASTTSG